MSAATVLNKQGQELRIVKGAYATIGALAVPVPAEGAANAAPALDALQAQGYRVLAVAAEPLADIILCRCCRHHQYLGNARHSDGATAWNGGWGCAGSRYVNVLRGSVLSLLWASHEFLTTSVSAPQSFSWSR